MSKRVGEYRWCGRYGKKSLPIGFVAGAIAGAMK